MTSSTLVRGSALLLVAVAALTLLPDASATSRTASVRALSPGVEVKAPSVNICSTKGNDDCPGWREPVGAPNYGVPRAIVNTAIRWNRVGAWTAALQEACLRDIQQLAYLVQQNFDAFIANSNEGYCIDETLKWFGNAVVAGGARRAGSPVTRRFRAQTAACRPDLSGECRGMVCVLVNSFAGPYATCSAHLVFERNSTGRATTRAQAVEYATTLKTNARTRSIDWIAAGDFNLYPSQIPQPWSSWFHSVFNRATITVPNVTHQFDYIWVRKGSITSFGTSKWCFLGESDHCTAYSRFVN